MTGVQTCALPISVTVEEIVTLIREAGFTPAQRTTEYEILRKY